MNTLTRLNPRQVRSISSTEIQPSVSDQENLTHPSSNLLQGIMEGLIDGVMMISAQGELIHANAYALQICQKFILEVTDKETIPLEVWRCCQAVIDSREVFPQQSLTIEDEISSPLGAIRIRVRWLAVEIFLKRAYSSR
ncbi:MAG: hypothetical protein HC781_17610 [Leptolyngbyaceae cyanobacterium CSU_1_4]|nr:hypothetical protein [Leptolyngbyaceae cyanobacterium CSU_1_4]